jgi:hypothetical protein
VNLSKFAEWPHFFGLALNSQFLAAFIIVLL